MSLSITHFNSKEFQFFFFWGTEGCKLTKTQALQALKATKPPPCDQRTNLIFKPISNEEPKIWEFHPCSLPAAFVPFNKVPMQLLPTAVAQSGVPLALGTATSSLALQVG